MNQSWNWLQNIPTKQLLRYLLTPQSLEGEKFAQSTYNLRQSALHYSYILSTERSIVKIFSRGVITII